MGRTDVPRDSQIGIFWPALESDRVTLFLVPFHGPESWLGSTNLLEEFPL